MSASLSSFFIQNTHGDKVAAVEVLFAYRTVRHKQTFRFNDCISQLNWSLSQPKYSSARTKCEAIICNVLVPSLLEEVAASLNACAYATLSVDASNRKEQQMFPVLMRFFNPASGVQTKGMEFSSLRGETFDCGPLRRQPEHILRRRQAIGAEKCVAKAAESFGWECCWHWLWCPHLPQLPSVKGGLLAIRRGRPFRKGLQVLPRVHCESGGTREVLCVCWNRVCRNSGTWKHLVQHLSEFWKYLKVCAPIFSRRKSSRQRWKHISNIHALSCGFYLLRFRQTCSKKQWPYWKKKFISLQQKQPCT